MSPVVSETAGCDSAVSGGTALSGTVTSTVTSAGSPPCTPVHDTRAVSSQPAPASVSMSPTDGAASASTGTSLFYLTRCFLKDIVGDNPSTLTVMSVAAKLGCEKRRVYDLLNIGEALGIVEHFQRSTYRWVGSRNLRSRVVSRALESQGKVALIQAKSKGKSAYSPALQTTISPLRALATVAHASPSFSGFVSRSSCGRLADLSSAMVHVLISSPHALSLEAIDSQIGNRTRQSGDKDFRTVQRRLYDVANVLVALDLVQKKRGPTTLARRSQTVYQWVSAGVPDETTIRTRHDAMCKERASKAGIPKHDGFDAGAAFSDGDDDCDSLAKVLVDLGTVSEPPMGFCRDRSKERERIEALNRKARARSAPTTPSEREVVEFSFGGSLLSSHSPLLTHVSGHGLTPKTAPNRTVPFKDLSRALSSPAVLPVPRLPVQVVRITPVEPKAPAFVPASTPCVSMSKHPMPQPEVDTVRVGSPRVLDAATPRVVCRPALQALRQPLSVRQPPVSTVTAGGHSLPPVRRMCQVLAPRPTHNDENNPQQSMAPASPRMKRERVVQVRLQ
ncbi:E2F family protein [Kipferlia bialata]|uniref:E2F family protein n=1 Tax=Kipferlia bialata TaxID=797122 RepID=A0A9K3CV45_9EUKA|nr:E2F family protein [Kipferlia bialata]|eukprot:g3870.t1